MFENYESQLWSLGDVMIAYVLSGAVGYERVVLHKPAGFKTQRIIGGASALFVKLSEVAAATFVATHKDVVEVDPIRIIQAIVSGISFIGAGSIVKQREEKDVAYLTTAATILFSAGIGIGFGQYVLSVGITVLVILINSVAGRITPK